MERISLTQPLRINVRGFDREATAFDVGEHEVPASVAEYVRSHPEFGFVIDPESPVPVSEDDSAGTPSPVESSEETSDKETSETTPATRGRGKRK